jgi:hypothetical protein
MPCRDGGPSEAEEAAQSGRDNSALTAMLCGLVRALEDEHGSKLERTLDAVNWKAAGVTRAYFEAWWEQHKARDAARKSREEAARKRSRVAAGGLAKLTPEERAALNLKAAPLGV